MTPDTPAPWWATAVIYQVYPRSFCDSDGDGIGDLPGIISKLDHIAALGADAIWVSPFFRSPQRDAGYDVSDYCDVDPLFGTLDDADALIAQAHARGLKVIADIVPNHTSSDHEWFVEALESPHGSDERDRYFFRDGRGDGGIEPPNNWTSVFGGPAWTRVPGGVGPHGVQQWYLHLFDSSQPDLNWDNPWVAQRFDQILRFWFDRGIDGFRIDVANGLAKAPGLPDAIPTALGVGGESAPVNHPYWNRDQVHEVWRRWRAIAQSYDTERALVGEAWVLPLDRMAQWVRPDELHQTFNFAYLLARWDAEQLRNVIEESLRAFGGVGAPSTWVLSNHDTIRHPSRLALTAAPPHGLGLGQSSPEHPDPSRAEAIGRAASLLMLALPGSAYVYQGEELGLQEALDIPDDARQDPTWFRTEGAAYGRDGCRVPLPWVADAPAYGFSPSGASWLPQPAEFRAKAAQLQEADPESTLALYRTAIRLRRELALAQGTLTWNASEASTLDALITPPAHAAARSGGVRVVVNVSENAIPLPPGKVLVASGSVGDTIAPHTTVWLDVQDEA